MNKKHIETLICPYCFYTFESEENSSGKCLRCHQMKYKWKEYWNKNSHIPYKCLSAGWFGFEWKKIK